MNDYSNPAPVPNFGNNRRGFFSNNDIAIKTDVVWPLYFLGLRADERLHLQYLSEFRSSSTKFIFDVAST